MTDNDTKNILDTDGFPLGEAVKLPGAHGGGKSRPLLFVTGAMAGLMGLGGGSLLDEILGGKIEEPGAELERLIAERQQQRLQERPVPEMQFFEDQVRANCCSTCNGRREIRLLLDTGPAMKEIEHPILGKRQFTINTPYRRSGTALVGRNEPCPCGSGKKNKRCHNTTGQPTGRFQFMPETCHCQRRGQMLMPAVA